MPHGLRSSFRNWAAEQTNAPHDVAEAAQVHSMGNATETANFSADLFELRRALINEWRDFLEGGG